MTLLTRYIGCGLLLWLVVVPAWGDEHEDGDQLEGVEMEVVGDPDADESDYVDEISLPEAIPGDEAAEENAGFGIDTANEARREASEAGRDFGQSTADEARNLFRDADNAAKAGNGAEGGSAPELPVQVP